MSRRRRAHRRIARRDAVRGRPGGDDDRHDDDRAAAPADDDNDDHHDDTTPTPTVPRPTTIAAGVTVGGDLLVGGLSPAAATAVIKDFFARPVTLQLGKVSLRATPKQLGAVRVRRRRRQARPHRQAGSERAAEGRGAAAADPALHRRDRAALRPHACRLGVVAPERQAVRDQGAGRPPPPPVDRGARRLQQPQDPRPRADLAPDRRAHTAEDAGVDRRCDRDSPRFQQAQLL